EVHNGAVFEVARFTHAGAEMHHLVLGRAACSARVSHRNGNLLFTLFVALTLHVWRDRALRYGVDLVVVPERSAPPLEEFLGHGRQRRAGWPLRFLWENDDAAEEAVADALRKVT